MWIVAVMYVLRNNVKSNLIPTIQNLEWLYCAHLENLLKLITETMTRYIVL